MSEQLTSFVRDGSSISMHSLIRTVGKGSNRHDFVGDVLIILSTASSDSCLKTVIFMSSLCGVGVRVRVRARVNNFSSKTTRPRDVLFF